MCIIKCRHFFWWPSASVERKLSFHKVGHWYKFVMTITVSFFSDDWYNDYFVLQQTKTWQYSWAWFVPGFRAIRIFNWKFVNCGHFYWEKLAKPAPVWAWISNYTHVKRWDVKEIIHAFLNFHYGLDHGHAWVITSHIKQWMWLLVCIVWLTAIKNEFVLNLKKSGNLRQNWYSSPKWTSYVT